MQSLESSIYHIAVSSELPADQRYEHWLTPMLSDFEAAGPNAQQRKNFQGQVYSLVTATSELHDMQSDDFAGSRSRQRIRHHENDKLALIYVVQGQVFSQHEGDTDLVTQAGQFLLFDAHHPNRLHFCRQPRFVQINLPRHRLQPILSNKPSPSQISQAVSRSGLASLLATQLAQFRNLSPELSPFEQRAYLNSTETLASHVLESVCLDGQRHATDRHNAIFTAARHYIDRHLDAAHLNGATVAAALGCSRATLYRAFAEQNLRVAEYIRELRLQTLARLLQHPASHQQPIAQLAWRCGLHEATNISRLFRQRFGMTPRDFRALRHNHPVFQPITRD